MEFYRWLVVALLLAAAGCTSEREPAKGPNNQGAPDDAEKVVRAAIAALFKVDPSAIPMDRPISELPLKADDLALVELIMELEERQRIVIPDAAIERYLGGQFGSVPPRITPNQLVSIVREAPKDQPSKRKK